MRYLYKNRIWIGMLLFLALSYNLYFIFLLPAVKIWYLCYVDLLLALAVLLAAVADAVSYYKKEAQKAMLLQYDSVICRELEPRENLDIAQHDVSVLEKQLREQFAANCDLQDYIAAWCHEVKLPLSASLLMNEKITDSALRMSQKQQLETIRQQLNGALLGCKVQSNLFDLQIRAVSIADCVKTAIHNNQYFLIRKKFELQMCTKQARAQDAQTDATQNETNGIEPVSVYTDPSWFVYILDQLIQNAVKYAAEKPVLKICLELDEKKQGSGVRLIVWDNGEGILERDIRRIFERGYTGSNHHNGKYKSTGMGLYMAARILEKLGHTIFVQSEFGVYTQFVITVCSAGAE